MIEDFDSDLKKTSKPVDPLKLRLSGRCFDKGFDIAAAEKGFHGAMVYEVYSFDINLDINPDFLDCDLKDVIELFQKKDNKIIFRGIIKDSLIEGKKAKLIAEDFSLIMKYVTIRGLETSRYLSPRDIASLLLEPFFYDDIRLGNAPGICDTSMRDFIIIVPVKNLILKEDITIGNVKFYYIFDTLDDKIIRKMDYGKNIPDWRSNQTRARVVINASEFKIALFNGYGKISTAIDLITLRNDLSFPRISINGENEYLNFHYNDLAAEVTIPSWVYCREAETDYYAIFNIDFPKDNALNLGYNSLKYFDVINQLFSDVLCKDYMTPNEKKILMVLHWLRRAIQDRDNRDKLLDLWTAMEFLISRTKVIPLFSEEQKDLIRHLLSSSPELTAKQKEVLFNKIDMLNSPPLMAKIDALKKELDINLTEEELKLLDRARKKRNSIIHGEKDVIVYNKE
jgi:hypothetical protein